MNNINQNVDGIIKEVLSERQKQDNKWGQQNHSSIVFRVEGDARNNCLPYEMPSENKAKDMCENAFRMGEGSWAHIALEEFAEVICAPNEKLRRGELIQLAAVLFAWIGSIDRNQA